MPRPKRRRRRRNSFGEIEHQDAPMTPEACEKYEGWTAPSFVSVVNPDWDPSDPASPRFVLVPSDRFTRVR